MIIKCCKVKKYASNRFFSPKFTLIHWSSSGFLLKKKTFSSAISHALNIKVFWFTKRLTEKYSLNLVVKVFFFSCLTIDLSNVRETINNHRYLQYLLRLYLLVLCNKGGLLPWISIQSDYYKKKCPQDCAFSSVRLLGNKTSWSTGCSATSLNPAFLHPTLSPCAFWQPLYTSFIINRVQSRLEERVQPFL